LNVEINNQTATDKVIQGIALGIFKQVARIQTLRGASNL
jgi:hypothetical protein